MKKLFAFLLAFSVFNVYAAGTGASQPSSFPSIIMLVVFVAIFYFLLIRPQMKRNKEQRQLVSAIEKDDEVFTTSGIYGKVVKVEEGVIELEIAKETVVKMQKQAIGGLLPKGSVAIATPAKSDAKPKAKSAAKKTTSKAKKD